MPGTCGTTSSCCGRRAAVRHPEFRLLSYEDLRLRAAFPDFAAYAARVRRRI
jgi:hypothetical protein